MEREQLIIFYRNPVIGKVKTRLASDVGEERALAIYLLLANHTMHITRDLRASKTVYYSSHIDREDNWDNYLYTKDLQAGNDLGERMQNAFAKGFNKGYRSICIIGTDCIGLNTPIIESAFAQLARYDAVVGPAKDGGYYLLGMKKLYSRLFTGKQWGNDTVLADTLSDLESMKLHFTTLPVLTDVDTVDDLPEEWRR